MHRAMCERKSYVLPYWVGTMKDRGSNYVSAVIYALLKRILLRDIYVCQNIWQTWTLATGKGRGKHLGKIKKTEITAEKGGKMSQERDRDNDRNTKPRNGYEHRDRVGDRTRDRDKNGNQGRDSDLTENIKIWTSDRGRYWDTNRYMETKIDTERDIQIEI